MKISRARTHRITGTRWDVPTHKPWRVLSVFLIVIAVIAVSGRVTTVQATANNPVVLENQQPGSDQWRLNLPGFQEADDATGQIKGYASATSVNKGQPITFFVTVNPAQTYTIDVYRMGWYQSKGGRLMQHIG